MIIILVPKKNKVECLNDIHHREVLQEASQIHINSSLDPLWSTYCHNSALQKPSSGPTLMQSPNSETKDSGPILQQDPSLFGQISKERQQNSLMIILNTGSLQSCNLLFHSSDKDSQTCIPNCLPYLHIYFSYHMSQNTGDYLLANVY